APSEHRSYGAPPSASMATDGRRILPSPSTAVDRRMKNPSQRQLRASSPITASMRRQADPGREIICFDGSMVAIDGSEIISSGGSVVAIDSSRLSRQQRRTNLTSKQAATDDPPHDPPAAISIAHQADHRMIQHPLSQPTE
ncbi:hypothetical protein ACLOJK_007106, partial [Asimina triloba]